MEYTGSQLFGDILWCFLAFHRIVVNIASRELCSRILRKIRIFLGFWFFRTVGRSSRTIISFGGSVGLFHFVFFFVL
jgi:hypothetical protein